MAAAGDKPVMLLLDIPDEGGFYLSETHEITTESVAAFLKAKDDGRLTRMQLSRG
jgi:nucleoredoxin